MQHRFGNPKDTYFRRFVRPKGERLEARHLLTTTSIVVGDWLRIHGDETINNDQLRIENARASFLGLPSGFQAGDLHLGSVVAFDDNQDGEVDGVTLSDTLPIASVSLGLGQTEVIRLRAPALEFQEFVYRPYAADMEGSGAIVITAAAADAFPEDDEPRIGDLDEDGDVDADDRFRLRENWTGALSAGSGGKVRAEGDLDGDQDVDSLDYTLLVTHWTDTAKLARTPVGSIDVHTGALSMLVTALGGQPVRLNGLLPMMLSEITTEHVPHSDQVDYVATGVPDIDLLTRTWSSQLDSFALETSIDFFSTATNRYESYGGQSLEFELSVNEGTIVPADTPALRVHLQNVTMPINDQLDSVTLAGTIEAVGFDTRGVPRNGSGASADTSSDVYLRLIPDETSEVSGQVEAIGSWTFQPNGIALELQGVARLQQVEPLTGEPDSGSYVVAVHWPVAPRDPNSQPNDGLEVTAEINHPLIADPSTLNATSEGISVLQSVLTDLSSRLAVEPVSLPLLTDGMDAVQLLQSAVDPIAAVYLTEFNPTDAASLFAPPFTFICQSNDETCVSDEVFRASLHLTGAELPTTSIESQLDVSRIGALAEFAPGGTWSATQRPVGQIEFGVDAGGFFLDASSSIGSTILGTVTGAGSYGLLDVGLQGEFSFSPRLVFAPLDTNSDGKIHTSELTSEAWGVANVQLSHVEAELDVTLQNGLLDYVDVDANPANNSARGGDPFQFVARTRLASSTFSASGLEPTWSEITVLNPDVDGDQIDDFSFIQLTQNAELLARDVISGGRLALLSGIDEALRGVPVPLAAPGVHTSLAEALQFGTALSTATFDNVRVLDRVNTTRLANWLNDGFPETPDEIIRLSVDVAGIPLDGIEQLPLNLRSLFPSLTGDATARIRDARLSGELVLGIDTSTASPAYLLPSDTGLGAEFELVVDLSGQSLGDGMFRFDAAEAVLAPKIRLEFTGEDNVKFRLTDLFDQLPPISVMLEGDSTFSLTADSAQLFHSSDDSLFDGSAAFISGTVDVTTGALEAEAIEAALAIHDAVTLEASFVQFGFDPTSGADSTVAARLDGAAVEFPTLPSFPVVEADEITVMYEAATSTFMLNVSGLVVDGATDAAAVRAQLSTAPDPGQQLIAAANGDGLEFDWSMEARTIERDGRIGAPPAEEGGPVGLPNNRRYANPSHFRVSFELPEVDFEGIAAEKYTVSVFHASNTQEAVAIGDCDLLVCSFDLPRRDRDEQDAPRDEYVEDYLVQVEASIPNASFEPIVFDQLITVRDILVVAIGDSYSSGEGNPDIPRSRDSNADPDPDFDVDPDATEDVPPHWLDVGDWSRYSWEQRDPKFASSWDLRNLEQDQLRQHYLAHRGSAAASAQYALELERSDPHSSVTFVFVSASGATIDVGGVGPYAGRDDTGFDGYEHRFGQNAYDEKDPMPPQIDQVAHIVGDRPIDVMTMSFGGNDVGFADVATALVLADRFEIEIPGTDLDVQLRSNYDQLLETLKQAILDGTEATWKKVEQAIFPLRTLAPLFGALPGVSAVNQAAGRVLLDLIDQWRDNVLFKGKLAGLNGLLEDFRRLNERVDSRLKHRPRNILITEYPDVTRGPGGVTCEDGILTELLPILKINQEELDWVRENMLDPLNEVVEQAAREFGWTFVAGVGDLFHGHAQCADDRYVLTELDSREVQGPDALKDTVGTLHPNSKGTAAQKERLVQATDPTMVGQQRPLVIVPDLGASLPIPGQHNNWVANLGYQFDTEGMSAESGLHPDGLRLNPVMRSYQDLISELQQAGYVLDEPGLDPGVTPSLFVANYDWRLNLAPRDDASRNSTGRLERLVTGEPAKDGDDVSITDGTLHYAVDYLGHTLKQIAERLDVSTVDVIAHGVGGLVTRAYVQSNAYHGTYKTESGLTRALPNIGEFVMVGVPNDGQIDAWTVLHDNWNTNNLTTKLLKPIANLAYQKLSPDGSNFVINTPLGELTRTDILNPVLPDPKRFIRKYYPVLEDLVPTYDFIDELAGLTNGDWLRLLDPEINTLSPALRWSFNNVDVDQVNLYVSTQPPGKGLLPWDYVVGDEGYDDPELLDEFGFSLGDVYRFDGTTSALDTFAPEVMQDGQRVIDLRSSAETVFLRDINPNRVLSRFDLREGDQPAEQFALADIIADPDVRDFALTAGQKYYWAVEAVPGDTSNQQRRVAVGSFEIPPVTTGETKFSGVTLVIHGFQTPYANRGRVPERERELARTIARASDGVVLEYVHDSEPTPERGAKPLVGTWKSDSSNPNKHARDALGKSLILLPNWATDSAISDSGFAEAAADAIFAALVELNERMSDFGQDTLQNALFRSNFHLIGFDRGAVVATEIAQRLGTLIRDRVDPRTGTSLLPDLHVTSLDPRDFVQPSLNVNLQAAIDEGTTELLPFALAPGVGAALFSSQPFVDATLAISGNRIVEYGDFRDPRVVGWDTTDFQDNYWQSTADPREQPVPTSFAPNGRPLNHLFSIDVSFAPLLDASFPNQLKIQSVFENFGVAITQDQAGSVSVNAAGEHWTIAGNPPFELRRQGNAIHVSDQSQPTSADIDVELNARPGFTESTPLGAPHDRVLSWYAGTVDLQAPQFRPSGLPEVESDAIRRRRLDGDATTYQVDGQPNLSPWYQAFETDPAFPWVSSQVDFYGNETYTVSSDATSESASSEGIGAGWAYSALGGGTHNRPISGNRLPVTQDNSRYKPGDAAVPTVFNGHFDVSMRPKFGRFPFAIPGVGQFASLLDFLGAEEAADVLVPSHREIPGWSFHGGSGGHGQGDGLVEIIEVGELIRIFGDKIAFTPEFLADVPADFRQDAEQFADVVIRFVTALGGQILEEDTAIGKLKKKLTLPLDILKFLGLDVKAFVAGELHDLIRELDSGVINQAYQIHDLTGTISHNRMYFPADKSVLAFDYWIKDKAKRNNALQFEFYDSFDHKIDHPVSVGDNFFFLGEKSDNFVGAYVTIPPQLLGKVGRFEITPREPGLGVGFQPQVLLDNFRLEGLTLKDSSGSADDQLLFFYEQDETIPDEIVELSVLPDLDDEGLDETPGTAPEAYKYITEVTAIGQDRHVLTIENNSPKPTDVIIFVQGGEFLRYIPDTPASDEQESAPVAFNHGSASDVGQIVDTFEIPGRDGDQPGSRQFIFDAHLPADYMHNLNAEQAVQLLHDTIIVVRPATDQDNPAVGLEVQRYNAFYLVDAADDSFEDNVIKFGTTLSNHVRSLPLELPEGVGVSVTTIDSNGGNFEYSRRENELRFVADAATTTGIDPRTSSVGLLEFTYQGQPLHSPDDPESQPKLFARSVGPHKLQISLGALKSAVMSLIGSENPALGTFLEEINPEADSEALEDNLTAFIDGFRDAFTEVYRSIPHRFIEVSADASSFMELDESAALPELVVDFFRADTSSHAKFRLASDFEGVGDTTGGRSPGNALGFYYGAHPEASASDIYGFSELLLGEITPDGANPDVSVPLREFLSPMAKRYRLEAVLNQIQFANFFVFVDNMARRATRVDSDERTPHRLGQMFGRTAAHEFGHNLGLLDEYTRERTRVHADHSLMSKSDTGILHEDTHLASLRLALHNPDRTLPAEHETLDSLIYGFWEPLYHNYFALNESRTNSFRVLPRDIVPSPAAAAQGAPEASAVSSSRSKSTLIGLESFADAASSLWNQSLATTAALAVRFETRDLPAGQIAEARVSEFDAHGRPIGGTIVLDPTADGHGWYRDQTPLVHTEFDVATSAATALDASATSVAHGAYDLFTVVLHEYGHLAGFISGWRGFDQRVHTIQGSQLFVTDDVSAVLSDDGSHLRNAQYPLDLMSSILQPSQRRLPSELDAMIIDAARSGSSAQTTDVAERPSYDSPFYQGFFNPTFVLRGAAATPDLAKAENPLLQDLNQLTSTSVETHLLRRVDDITNVLGFINGRGDRTTVKVQSRRGNLDGLETFSLIDTQPQVPADDVEWYTEGSLADKAFRKSNAGDGAVNYAYRRATPIVVPLHNSPKLVRRVRIREGASGGDVIGTSSSARHEDLLANPEVQAAVLSTLGITAPLAAAAHSTSSASGGSLLNVTGVTHVNQAAALEDAEGNQVGIRQGTVVTDIPNSFFFGAADGFGYIVGETHNPLEFTVDGTEQVDGYLQASPLGPRMRGGQTLDGSSSLGQAFDIFELFPELGIPDLLEIRDPVTEANFSLSVSPEMFEFAGDITFTADSLAIFPDLSTEAADGIVVADHVFARLEVDTASPHFGKLVVRAQDAKIDLGDTLQLSATGDETDPALELVIDPESNELATVRGLSLNVPSIEAWPTELTSLDELVVRRDGFGFTKTFGIDTPIPQINLGQSPRVVEISQPQLSITVDVAVPNGRFVAPHVTGQVEVAASSATLLPNSVFSANITDDNPLDQNAGIIGSLDLGSGEFDLQLRQLDARLADLFAISALPENNQAAVSLHYDPDASTSDVLLALPTLDASIPALSVADETPTATVSGLALRYGGGVELDSVTLDLPAGYTRQLPGGGLVPLELTQVAAQFDERADGTIDLNSFELAAVVTIDTQQLQQQLGTVLPQEPVISVQSYDDSGVLRDVSTGAVIVGLRIDDGEVTPTQVPGLHLGITDLTFGLSVSTSVTMAGSLTLPGVDENGQIQAVPASLVPPELSGLASPPHAVLDVSASADNATATLGGRVLVGGTVSTKSGGALGLNLAGRAELEGDLSFAGGAAGGTLNADFHWDLLATPSPDGSLTLTGEPIVAGLGIEDLVVEVEDFARLTVASAQISFSGQPGEAVATAVDPTLEFLVPGLEGIVGTIGRVELFDDEGDDGTIDGFSLANTTLTGLGQRTLGVAGVDLVVLTDPTLEIAEVTYRAGELSGSPLMLSAAAAAVLPNSPLSLTARSVDGDPRPAIAASLDLSSLDFTLDVLAFEGSLSVGGQRLFRLHGEPAIDNSPALAFALLGDAEPDDAILSLPRLLGSFDALAIQRDGRTLAPQVMIDGVGLQRDGDLQLGQVQLALPANYLNESLGLGGLLPVELRELELDFAQLPDGSADVDTLTITAVAEVNTSGLEEALGGLLGTAPTIEVGRYDAAGVVTDLSDGGEVRFGLSVSGGRVKPIEIPGTRLAINDLVIELAAGQAVTMSGSLLLPPVGPDGQLGDPPPNLLPSELAETSPQVVLALAADADTDFGEIGGDVEVGGTLIPQANDDWLVSMQGAATLTGDVSALGGGASGTISGDFSWDLLVSPQADGALTLTGSPQIEGLLFEEIELEVAGLARLTVDQAEIDFDAAEGEAVATASGSTLEFLIDGLEGVGGQIGLVQLFDDIGPDGVVDGFSISDATMGNLGTLRLGPELDESGQSLVELTGSSLTIPDLTYRNGTLTGSLPEITFTAQAIALNLPGVNAEALDIAVTIAPNDRAFKATAGSLALGVGETTEDGNSLFNVQLIEPTFLIDQDDATDLLSVASGRFVFGADAAPLDALQFDMLPTVGNLDQALRLNLVGDGQSVVPQFGFGDFLLATTTDEAVLASLGLGGILPLDVDSATLAFPTTLANGYTDLSAFDLFVSGEFDFEVFGELPFEPSVSIGQTPLIGSSQNPSAPEDGDGRFDVQIAVDLSGDAAFPVVPVFQDIVVGLRGLELGGFTFAGEVALAGYRLGEGNLPVALAYGVDAEGNYVLVDAMADADLLEPGDQLGAPVAGLLSVRADDEVGAGSAGGVDFDFNGVEVALAGAIQIDADSTTLELTGDLQLDGTIGFGDFLVLDSFGLSGWLDWTIQNDLGGGDLSFGVDQVRTGGITIRLGELFEISASGSEEGPDGVSGTVDDGELALNFSDDPNVPLLDGLAVTLGSPSIGLYGGIEGLDIFAGAVPDFDAIDEVVIGVAEDSMLDTLQDWFLPIRTNEISVSFGDDFFVLPIGADANGDPVDVQLKVDGAVGVPGFLGDAIDGAGLDAEVAFAGLGVDVGKLRDLAAELLTASGQLANTSLDAFVGANDQSAMAAAFAAGLDYVETNGLPFSVLELGEAIDISGLNALGLELGFEIGQGLAVRGALAVGKADANQQADSSVDDVYFLLIDGAVRVSSYGGGGSLVLTTAGPIAATIEFGVPIPIGQTTLTVGGAGGIVFGKKLLDGVDTSQPTINPADIPTPLEWNLTDVSAIQSTLEDIFVELWDEEDQSLAPLWNQPATLAIRGELSSLAVLGLVSLSGDIAASLPSPTEAISGQGLQFMGVGNLNVVGLPFATGGVLVDTTDLLNPSVSFGFRVPPEDNPLGFLFPVQTDLAGTFRSDGMIEAWLVGLSTLVEGALGNATGPVAKLLDLVAEDIERDRALGIVNRLAQLVALPSDQPLTGSSIAATLLSVFGTLSGESPIGDLDSNSNDPWTFAAQVANELWTQLSLASERLQDFDFASAMGSVFASLLEGAADSADEAIVRAFDAFNPSFVLRGAMQPTILGFPIGDPLNEVDLVINKRRITLDLTTTNVLATALAPLRDLAGLSDRLEFGFTASLPGELIEVLIDRDATIDQIVAAFGDALNPFTGWEAKFAGTVSLLGFELGKVSGVMFGPQETDGEGNATGGTLFAENVYNFGHPDDLKLNGNNTDLDTVGAADSIPVYFDSRYQNMVEFGGLLLTGELVIPDLLRDPVATFNTLATLTQQTGSALAEPWAELADGFDLSDLSAAGTVASELQQYVQDVIAVLTDQSPLGTLQIYVPSPATLVDGYLDYAIPSVVGGGDGSGEALLADRIVGEDEQGNPAFAPAAPFDPTRPLPPLRFADLNGNAFYDAKIDVLLDDSGNIWSDAIPPNQLLGELTFDAAEDVPVQVARLLGVPLFVLGDVALDEGNGFLDKAPSSRFQAGVSIGIIDSNHNGTLDWSADPSTGAISWHETLVAFENGAELADLTSLPNLTVFIDAEALQPASAPNGYTAPGPSAAGDRIVGLNEGFVDTNDNGRFDLGTVYSTT